MRRGFVRALRFDESKNPWLASVIKQRRLRRVAPRVARRGLVSGEETYERSARIDDVVTRAVTFIIVLACGPGGCVGVRARDELLRPARGSPVPLRVRDRFRVRSAPSPARFSGVLNQTLVRSLGHVSETLDGY